MIKHKIITFILLGLMSSATLALEPFQVDKIQVDGLERISVGTVFNYLPIEVGDTLTDAKSAKAIRALYKTGFFQDIRFFRQGNTLLITVQERASIAKVEITGNQQLDSDQLLQALKEIGLAEGRVFNRSLLDKVEQELRRQYFSAGKYGVQINSSITELERNRVEVSIDIIEGRVAKIKQINITGNHSFSDEDLLEVFQLSTPTIISFYTQSDQYSKQKLSADLESLQSFYRDRGYINFKIESTEVAITPDKQDIYLAINIKEGDVYHIKEVKLTGQMVVPKEELFPLIKIPSGSTFSQRSITESSTRITDHLGKSGFAFAEVNMLPSLDAETKEVSLTFVVDPGRRVYVRRINMIGNTKTRDEVLRREMRQMESGWIATDKVERSRIRLQRLGFFDDVAVETVPVPGTNDQVDINFTVTEKASGNLLAGLGFSQSQGFIFNASVTQDNFLGSGKRISFTFNNSEFNTTYQFAYVNPYYTIDGISRGFRFSYNKIDASQVNISNYSTNSLVAGMVYGFPLNEFDRFSVSFDVEQLDINLGRDPSDEVEKFVEQEGKDFTSFKTTLGWSHDTRNRAIFPTRGGLQSASLELAVPGGDLNYYKLNYRQLRYFPLTKALIILLKGDFGYGDGYGHTSELPFFKNFFAGGSRTVRGFEDNTLGPRDSNNDPIGGNLKVIGNLELIFPVPFLEDKRSIRMSGFVDAGNVFDGFNDFDVADIRFSVGLGAQWLSPIGALTFSLAKPLNDESNDDTQFFQFSFGSTF